MKSFSDFITEAPTEISVAGGNTQIAPEVKAAYDWYTKKYPKASEKNKQYALGALDAAYRKRKQFSSDSVGKKLDPNAADGSRKAADSNDINFGAWKTGKEPDYIQQMHRNMDTADSRTKVTTAAQNSRVGTNTFAASVTANAKADQEKAAAGDRLNRDQRIIRRVDSVMTKAAASKTAAQNDQNNKAKQAITKADLDSQAFGPNTPETAKPVGQTSARGAVGKANRAMAVRAAAKAGDILPSGDAKADFRLRDFAKKQKELKSIGAVSDRAKEIRDAQRTQSFQQAVAQKARDVALSRVDFNNIPRSYDPNAAAAAEKLAATMRAKAATTAAPIKPVVQAVRPSGPVGTLPVQRLNPQVGDRAAQLRAATTRPRAVNAATAAYQNATRFK